MPLLLHCYSLLFHYYSLLDITTAGTNKYIAITAYYNIKIPGWPGLRLRRPRRLGAPRPGPEPPEAGASRGPACPGPARPSSSPPPPSRRTPGRSRPGPGRFGPALIVWPGLPARGEGPGRWRRREVTKIGIGYGPGAGIGLSISTCTRQSTNRTSFNATLRPSRPASVQLVQGST
jgi:hypothetical protein